MKHHETVGRLLAVNARHGGVLTRRQAAAAGAGDRLLLSLERSGILVRRHPGVWVLAARAGDHAVLCRAALAALPTGSVISHRSAAWLMGVLGAPARPPAEVHATVIAAHPLRPKGVIVHRTDFPAGVRLFVGVRCSPPARTLVDLAAVSTAGELEAAVDRALAAGVVRLHDILAEAAARPRHGGGRLRRSLEARRLIGAPTPSVLESRMTRLLVRAGLPLPRAEVVVGPSGEYRLDYAYQERWLAVEVHGYAWHHTPEQLARDLARHRRLTLEGWTVVTFTWADVVYGPDRVAAELAALLNSPTRALPR